MVRWLLVGVLLPLLTACTIPFLPTPADPTPSPTPSALVIDLGGGIELTALGDESTWESTGEGRCADETHRVTTATGDYQVTLLRADCAGQPRALNGFHGYFVDPPANAEVAAAATPIGAAAVFSNEYVECTNSCNSGTDEVALVAVGARTLQVIAVARVSRTNHTRDRGQLIDLLQGLRRS